MRLLLTFIILFSTSAYSAGYYVNSPAGMVRFNSAAGYYQLSYALERAADSNTRAPARLVKDVKYTTGGLRNLLKLKSLTPAGFALSAALVAAEYFINPETGEVSKGSPGYTGLGSCVSYNDVTLQFCTSLAQDTWPNVSSFTYDIQSNRIAINAVHNFYNTWGYFYPNEPVEQGTNLDSSFESISDSEFETEVLPQIAWGDVSFDESSNQPVVTPELQQELDATNNWYFDNYEDNSQTITTTSTATTVINQDNSTTTTEVANQDMPAFCNWAGIVCDLANWFQSEPDLPANSELPIDEIDRPDGWSYVGLEGCPNPLSNDIMGETVTIEFTPFCEYASLLRPFILGSSIFTAALIVLGARAEA